MAYWVKRDLIAWPSDIEGCECFLHASKSADLNLSGNEIEGEFLINLIQVIAVEGMLTIWTQTERSNS
jgi:hypothetical protein